MDKKPKTATKYVFWMIAFFIILGLATGFCQINSSRTQNISYSELENQIKSNNIRFISIWDSGRIEGQFNNAVQQGIGFRSSVSPNLVPDLKNKLDASSATYDFPLDSSSGWIGMLLGWSPMLLLIGFWIFMMRRMQGSGAGGAAMSFGKSKAKLSPSNGNKVTFKDVAGIDEAKEELKEIIEFLREPRKFQELGGRIPKGVLLIGPPGTGKTLLARAVAGEASVPFFSISGSDFIEMFVGVGASRVRDLFEQGNKNAPCIIFIDEIDAVGRHRGAGLGGGHDEREQTLNQLLAEMDGFQSNEGVILMAATNRPDVLDLALLRPGRFDRQVMVDRPDLLGREGILKVHTRKIPLDDDIKDSLKIIARGTVGFSGADLANLVNEAALNAARRKNKNKTVAMEDFEFARDKVMMGSERRSMAISDKEKRTIAIHEAGHALLATILPNAEPVHKVTITPRGLALGLTQQLPEDEKHSYSEPYLKDMVTVFHGGRVAEKVIDNIITTGASNDLERATEFARRMVCEWGMSEKMGPLTFGKKERQIFLGREIAQHRDYSEDTAIQIDKEVKRIIAEACVLAEKLIREHRDKLELIIKELLDRETISGDDVRRIVYPPNPQPQS